MNKFKKIFTAVIIALALCVGIFTTTACNTSAVARADDNIPTVETIDDGVELYGVYTKIKLYMEGGNGEVWAVAKNTFTLFPSKVHVYVYLYSSDTYQEDYNNMTLMAKNYIDDLNIGKSVEARASTGGVAKYWRARISYRVDGKDLKELETDTFLADADGIYI